MGKRAYETPKVSRISTCSEQAFGATCGTGNWFRVRDCTTGMNAETSCSFGFMAQGVGCDNGYQPDTGGWCLQGPSFRRP